MAEKKMQLSGEDATFDADLKRTEERTESHACDLISRQEALEALGDEPEVWTDSPEEIAERNQWARDVAAIKAVPSAQPERLTDDDFETIRIHLNAYKEKLCNQQRWEEAEEYQRIIDRFMAFASAQPERCEDCVNFSKTRLLIPQPELDEWCTDCAEYDHDRHCCPRYNRVIRNAMQSAQPETAKRIVGSSRDGMTMWYQCDMCKEPVDKEDVFCPGCGRRLLDE